MNPASSDLSLLLCRSKSGDSDAANDIIPLVYDELRALACRYLRRERPGHTLQPTALVHEACLRLLGSYPSNLTDRAHFLAIAATVMRRVLVDYSRSHTAGKRGGGACKLSLEDVNVGTLDAQTHEVLDLDAAMDRLRSVDPKLSRIVELRYFGGLTVEECAEILQVSPRTIKRDWTFARAWLRGEMGQS